MSADRLANFGPNTTQTLLNRQLEPDIAYAIDPPGTIEVDDAIRVVLEKPKNGQRPTAHITTYIADTAIHGSDPDIFERAKTKCFTDYSNPEPDYMLPIDMIDKISLGNGGELGVPAIAVRTIAHGGHVALIGIDRVRVQVKACSYDEFDGLMRADDEPAVDIAIASMLLRGLGFYSAQHNSLDSHNIVASHMLMVNAQLANMAIREGLPWIYRSFSGRKGKGYGDGKHNRKIVGHYTHRPRLHRGLGSVGVRYCHFTSPMRRGPDLFDHQVLASYLDGTEPELGPADMRDLAICANSKMRQLQKHT